MLQSLTPRLAKSFRYQMSIVHNNVSVRHSPLQNIMKIERSRPGQMQTKMDKIGKMLTFSVVWGLEGKESLFTDSDLSDPSEPIPLDSLETDGLGLVCDWDKPAMSMNELKELKFSVSNPVRGSATLRAISANGNEQIYCNYTCINPTACEHYAVLTESNAPIYSSHRTH